MEVISVATADWGTIRKAGTGSPDDGCILAQPTVYASGSNGCRGQIHTMLTQAPLSDHGRMPQTCSSPNWVTSPPERITISEFAQGG